VSLQVVASRIECVKKSSDLSELRIASDEAIKLAETADGKRKQIETCFDQEIHSVRKEYEAKVMLCTFVCSLTVGPVTYHLHMWDGSVFTHVCLFAWSLLNALNVVLVLISFNHLFVSVTSNWPSYVQRVLYMQTFNIMSENC